MPNARRSFGAQPFAISVIASGLVGSHVTSAEGEQITLFQAIPATHLGRRKRLKRVMNERPKLGSGEDGLNV